jgi:hypothetical protein
MDEAFRPIAFHIHGEVHQKEAYPFAAPSFHE